MRHLSVKKTEDEAGKRDSQRERCKMEDKQDAHISFFFAVVRREHTLGVRAYVCVCVCARLVSGHLLSL